MSSLMNQIQAQNILRRIVQDPIHREVLAEATHLVAELQATTAGLKPEDLLRVACAIHPNETPLGAIRLMAGRLVEAQKAELLLKQTFTFAEATEEERLKPYDTACEIRLAQIQNELEHVHRTHRGKILGQNQPAERWSLYAGRGLSREEILQLGIPEVDHSRDFVEERNQWAIELQQITQALISERDVIHRFKETRNEISLPLSLVALVEGEK